MKAALAVENWEESDGLWKQVCISKYGIARNRWDTQGPSSCHSGVERYFVGKRMLLISISDKGRFR